MDTMQKPMHAEAGVVGAALRPSTRARHEGATPCGRAGRGPQQRTEADDDGGAGAAHCATADEDGGAGLHLKRGRQACVAGHAVQRLPPPPPPPPHATAASRPCVHACMSAQKRTRPRASMMARWKVVAAHRRWTRYVATMPSHRLSQRGAAR